MQDHRTSEQVIDDATDAVMASPRLRSIVSAVVAEALAAITDETYTSRPANELAKAVDEALAKLTG